jgi:glycosyltransferase involved in cell wall biosynthesis
VYYLAPDVPHPSGGTRTIYRHVDQLNAVGIDAVVVHHDRRFRCEWFSNNTRVRASADVAPSAQDLLVVPEWYAAGFGRLPADVRTLVFNQGPYHTFDFIPFAQTGPGEPYAGIPNLVGILTVSADGASLLRCTFPGIPVHQVRSVIDGRVFRPADRAPDRALAYLPRRRPDEIEHLLHILRSRGSLAGWRLVPIDRCTEAQTAELMRSCAIFLSFSHQEGFGLPPAEAMASGCYVVGYTGLGGRDYFDPDYCAPILDGDLVAFAHAVEEAMRCYEDSPEELLKRGRRASERILGHYHEAGLRGDLAEFFGQLLAQPACDLGRSGSLGESSPTKIAD